MKAMSLRTALLLVCLPLLPGCRDPVTPLDELNDARRRWEARGPSIYSYRIEYTCWCIPEYTYTASVHVDDKVVTGAWYLPDGPAVPAERLAGVPTVDQLFATIEYALEMRAARVVVRYDPALGYPTLVDIDQDVVARDDDRIILASDLTTATMSPAVR